MGQWALGSAGFRGRPGVGGGRGGREAWPACCPRGTTKRARPRLALGFGALRGSLGVHPWGF